MILLLIFIYHWGHNWLLSPRLIIIQWGSNRTNNIDGAEAVRVAHNAILVSMMHLATIALLCKQTTDNFRTRHPPEPRWRHLSGNRILFVPHFESFVGQLQFEPRGLQIKQPLFNFCLAIIKRWVGVLYRHTSGEAADVTTGVARGDGCVPYNCIHPSR